MFRKGKRVHYVSFFENCFNKGPNNNNNKISFKKALNSALNHFLEDAIFCEILVIWNLY